MTLDPHLVTVLATTCIAGYLMSTAGLMKNGLERRRPRRICPSCGRERLSCRCV